MNKNSIVYTVIFAFVSIFILVSILSVANEFAKGIIKKNKEIVFNSVVLQTMGYIVDDMSRDEIIQAYNDLDKQEVDGDFVALQSIKNKNILYSSVVAGETVYASVFAGAGLWGEIAVVVAVNQDVTLFKGMRVLSQVETPGLGSRIEEEWFMAQFIDQAIAADKRLRFVNMAGDGDDDKENNEVDSIAGATRTADAVQILINNAVHDLRIMLNVESQWSADEFVRDDSKEITEIVLADSVLQAMGYIIDGMSNDEIIEAYNDLDVQEVVGDFVAVQPIKNKNILYSSVVAGETVYASVFQEMSMGGEIIAVIAVNQDITRFKGIHIVQQSETPELGGRVEEQWFMTQFIDQVIAGDKKLRFIDMAGDGDDDKENNEVDSIGGATNTSGAMQSLVNNAVHDLRIMLNEKSQLVAYVDFIVNQELLFNSDNIVA